MRFSALLLGAAISAHPALGQSARPAVAIPRLDARINVDGSLDEPVWTQATLLDGFRQYMPSDSRPAQEKTEVLVWYAPDALMVGIRAFTADVASLRATRGFFTTELTEEQPEGHGERQLQLLGRTARATRKLRGAMSLPLCLQYSVALRQLRVLRGEKVQRHTQVPAEQPVTGAFRVRLG